MTSILRLIRPIALVLLMKPEENSAMELLNCYECKIQNERNYMCNNGGSLGTPDPWAVACCSEGDSHEFCQPSQVNKCSPNFVDSGPNFYTYCPKISAPSCGLFKQDSDSNMVLEASTKSQ